MAHVVGAGNVGQCLAVVASFDRLAYLVRRELWRAAELDAPGPGPRPAFAGAGADQALPEDIKNSAAPALLARHGPAGKGADISHPRRQHTRVPDGFVHDAAQVQQGAK